MPLRVDDTRSSSLDDEAAAVVRSRPAAWRPANAARRRRHRRLPRCRPSAGSARHGRARPEVSTPRACRPCRSSRATSIFRRRLARRRTRCSPSSPLNCSVAEIGCTWPFSARIQPFSETTTVIGSRSIIASAARDRSPRAHRRTRAALAELRRLRAEISSTSRTCQAMVFHCWSSSASSASISLPLGRELARAPSAAPSPRACAERAVAC